MSPGKLKGDAADRGEEAKEFENEAKLLLLMYNERVVVVSTYTVPLSSVRIDAT